MIFGSIWLSMKNKRKRKISFSPLILVGMIWLAACASNSMYHPPQILPDDRADISKPKPQEILIIEDTFEYGVLQSSQRAFDISRQLRNLVGNPRQALNVDAFGKVSNSTWFTNRNGTEYMSLAQIASGPSKGTGPETQGPWMISSVKEKGFTPGFTITDARGNKYLIKFDPYGFTELSSAAEVISTKILYAAGYNVPENYIIYFDPKILQMDEYCILYNDKGITCEMTTDDFDRIMKRVDRLSDGRVRAMASKFLDGKPLGGFRYLGTRNDDPNDIVPHEHRRELRGLYVLCSWIKHFDIKDSNTLDMYVDEDGRRFVKHYLIDFGSTLGSSTNGPMDAFRGQETEFDFRVLFRNLFTLGLNVKSWEKARGVEFPSVGRFESSDLNPGNAIMNYGNPAIINRTDLDCFWGAKLVMSFSDEQLAAIVKEGQYSDPAAETYTLKVLMERRDIIGRYWYSRVNCLDKFTIFAITEEAQELQFTDLGIERELWTKEKSRYRYSLKVNDIPIAVHRHLFGHTSIPLWDLEQRAQNLKAFKNPISSDDQWEITLWISRDLGHNWGKWVKVYMDRNPETNSFRVVGVKRQN